MSQIVECLYMVDGYGRLAGQDFKVIQPFLVVILLLPVKAFQDTQDLTLGNKRSTKIANKSFRLGQVPARKSVIRHQIINNDGSFLQGGFTCNSFPYLQL